MQTLSAQFTWSHIEEFIALEDDLKLLREENKMTPDLFFKDPYVLDFLGLQDIYSEKDLENTILQNLKNSYWKLCHR